MAYVIGVDVGGTFTDAVLDDDAGTVLAAKSPSTPPDYSRGVLDVLELLAEQLGRPLPEMLADTHHIAHGTTSSLNALVTGNVPPVGFLTTKGHRDSIFIMNVEGRYLGRSPHELQTRARPVQAARAAPEAARAGGHRADRPRRERRRRPRRGRRARGDPRAPGRRGARDRGVAAVVVPQPGARAAAARAGRARSTRTCSSRCRREVSPRIREFARNATTIMSTQIGPGLRDYLSSLEAALRERELAGPLLVMQTNGGAVAAARGARLRDQHGRVGPHRRCRRIRRAGPPARPPQHHLHRRRRHHVPRRAGRRRRAGARHAPRSSTTTRSTCRRCASTRSAPAAAPSPGSTRAATCGSARAARRPCPGPPATGSGGTEPTNTDANLVLGILPERGLLGGRKPLVGRARPAGHRHPDRQAARPHRRRGRGRDLRGAERADRRPAAQDRRRGRATIPATSCVYAFGGAGPAHCARYAAEVGVTEVVVPLGPVASAFSAFGLASSDIVLAAELSDPDVRPVRPGARGAQLRRLGAAGARRARPAGRAVRDRRAAPRDRHALLDAARRGHGAGRRTGRSTRPRSRPPRRRSSSATPSCTARTPGSARPASRRSPSGSAGSACCPFCPELPEVPAADAADPAAAQTGTPAGLPRRRAQASSTPPIYDYGALRAGHVLTGPAIVEVPTTTVVVPGGHHRHGRPPRQPAPCPERAP